VFEREIRDLGFLKRWSIVRTIRDQTVAEHTFNVAFYANDIADWLQSQGADISDTLWLSLLQQVLWHDLDEMFTGDIPGPAKRALRGSNIEGWQEKVRAWMDVVFGIGRHSRNGNGHGPKEQNRITAIIKLADILDAACEMATEEQLGNMNAVPMTKRNTDWALREVETLGDVFGLSIPQRRDLRDKVFQAVHSCRCANSKPPVTICDY